MQRKTNKVLPKTAGEVTNGGVYTQSVKCGKSNCKCARGETHPASYFFTRCNGKLQKFYVRKGEVEAFTEIVSQSALERQRRREATKISADLLKELRATLWRNDGLIKTLKGGGGGYELT